MTFDLTTIAIFSAAALPYNLLPARWRGWILLIGSVLAIYWLQTALVIRNLDFILPTATIVLTVMVWLFTCKPETWQEDRITLVLIVALVIGLSFMRFIQPEYRITPSLPPQPLSVALVLAGTAAIIAALWWILRRQNQWRVLTGIIVFIIGVFIILKTEGLAVGLAGFLREQTGRDSALATVNDLTWIGFSYIAFRLIHTLRDRQSGKLPALSLKEYLTYVIFFPAFISGPIDRAERFQKDLQALPQLSGFDAERYINGFTRIAVGIFKKFVIADSLALGLSLNAINTDQATSTIGLWILLYGYALRLFFDFSGYSDIAIGIGILFGITLPENFKAPYLKSDLASFWQSWHITLSTWARFYVFTPLSRVLLTRKPKPSSTVIVLSTQLTTMIVIGLWHGVTVNFIAWGIWHGIGLFIHKQWSDRTRKWYLSLKDKPGQKRAWTIFAWFITFHFVVLGWVWFALPDFEQSVRVFGRLFGL